MSLKRLNYVRCAVVCHGLSEKCIVNHIGTKLHLNIKTIQKNNGKSSIQIRSLNNFLDQNIFYNIKRFSNEYNIEYRKKQLINFKLFIIMDTDDCSDCERENFINKSMFKDHPLYDYIVPIYNITNLEDVMLKIGMMVDRVKNKDKSSYYLKTFPINNGPLTLNSYEEIKIFRNKLSKVKETNLDEFVNYALELAEQNKIHR